MKKYYKNSVLLHGDFLDVKQKQPFIKSQEQYEAYRLCNMIWQEMVDRRILNKLSVESVDVMRFMFYCPACNLHFDGELFGCGKCILSRTKICKEKGSLWQKWLSSMQAFNSLPRVEYFRKVNQSLIYAQEIADIFKGACDEWGMLLNK